jgi:hypothetical protein
MDLPVRVHGQGCLMPKAVQTRTIVQKIDSDGKVISEKVTTVQESAPDEEFTWGMYL